MNDELFRPRGLYCLIMSYDVKSRGNAVLPGQSDSPSHIIREGISKSDRLRDHDGVLGASNFPEVAELIYPNTLNLPEIDSEEDSGQISVRSAAWASSQAKIKEKWTAREEKEDLKSQVKFVGLSSNSKSSRQLYCSEGLSHCPLMLTALQQKKYPTSVISHLMDPKAQLGEKDKQKQEKREAELQKKDEKREREAEKRAQKYPDKAPKAHEPKEVPFTYSRSPSHVAAFC